MLQNKFEKMMHLQSRLSDFDLIRPGRELVKQGELQKISRKEVVPRYFILLSDCLLYTSYYGPWVDSNTALRVSYVIPLSQLRVVSGQRSDNLSNEFTIISNVRSFSVIARSEQERMEWIEAIESAKEDYHQKKQSFVSQASEQTVPGGMRPDELGDTAPVWIPDHRVTMCQLCHEEFSILVRRHHCRACGKVVCSTCSASKAPLKYLQFSSERVCIECCEILKQSKLTIIFLTDELKYFSSEYSSNSELMSRFKIRHTSRPVGRHVAARYKEVSAASHEDVQMSGYLKLRSGRGSSKWRQSWWVLKDRVLYRFEAMEDTVAKETMPVIGWTLETLSDVSQIILFYHDKLL